MNILYLHQHFALPSGSTGTRSYEFAKRWVKAGHKVTVICGHYDIGGLEYSKKAQIIDGIEIIIAGTRYSNKMSFIKRVFSFIGFIFSAFYIGLRQKDIDIIYATSTPLTIGIPAILLKWFKNIPFVFEVRDEWPRIPIEMGIIKNKTIIKFLYWLERFIYKQSNGIVALSSGMADGVKESLDGIDKEIIVAPNCCDTDRFSPDIDGNDIRIRHKWQDKFILLHFGAMGIANGLDLLINTAKSLKSYKAIQFIIIGDGSQKQRLADKVNELGLKNIEFIGSVSKNHLPFYVAACDVSLVVFADYPILEHNSANKFFDSLAAGKPVLLNYSGWQREIIEKHNAGFGCEQGDIFDFVTKIIRLYENQSKLKEMGLNARKLAEDQFSRDIQAEKILKFLECANA